MRWPATWQKIRCSWNSGTVTSCENSPACRRSTASHSAREVRPRGGPNSIAHINPRPRTSRTTAWRSISGRVSSSSFSPRRCARSISPSSSITRSVASAAAAATSLPPNVDPCRTARSIPSNTVSNAALETSVAPIGTKPPDSAFATHTMSGRRSQCSSARKRPVRAIPVCTSSQMNSVPVARQSSAACSR